MKTLSGAPVLITLVAHKHTDSGGREEKKNAKKRNSVNNEPDFWGRSSVLRNILPADLCESV